MEREGACEQFQGNTTLEVKAQRQEPMTSSERLSCKNRKEAKRYQSWKPSPKGRLRSVANGVRQFSQRICLEGRDFALQLWSLGNLFLFSEPQFLQLKRANIVISALEDMMRNK